MINSPRSLEACRQLGIIPNELYFQDFETYVKMNPEVIALPKEIQKIRFENIDNYRKETIQMVIDQREKIISLSQEKIFQTSINLKKTQNNTPELTSENNNDEKQMQIYNLDEQLNSMIEKEKKNLEKLKRRQKNEIEAEIESKIKSEMIRQKSELKEKHIQLLNEKLHEKLNDQAKKEEQKRIEKEKRRENDLKKKLLKQEEENKKKHEIEEKHLKEIKEIQEKERQEEIKKKIRREKKSRKKTRISINSSTRNRTSKFRKAKTFRRKRKRTSIN